MKTAAAILAAVTLAAAGAISFAQTAPPPAAPATPSLSLNRTPHPLPKAGELVSLAIKELGNFDYDPEKGGTIPADVKAMNGCKIRLTGFMIPLSQAGDGVTDFALVPSLSSCCFGQPPGIQHTITVHAPKGQALKYFTDPVAVVGTLKVEEKREDNYTVSIFEVCDASVEATGATAMGPVMQGKKLDQPDLNNAK